MSSGHETNTKNVGVFVTFMFDKDIEEDNDDETEAIIYKSWYQTSVITGAIAIVQAKTGTINLSGISRIFDFIRCHVR